MSEPQQTLTIRQALDLAVRHHTAGRLAEAENIYQRILQSHPDQPNALHLLGAIAHQTGRNDVAVDQITRALHLKPDYVEAHNNLGNAFQALGKLEEAVTSYRKALDLKPDYADAHNNLGVTLLELGRSEEAITSYRKALELKPDYADAQNNLGNALLELGRLEDAVASYGKALVIKPDFAEANNNLGSALHKLGKPEEAVASYRKALDLNSNYAEAHYNLGNALQDLERLEDAVASYHKALDCKSDYTQAHNNLGLALQDLDKLEDAIASYRRALAIDPDYAEAHYNLGNALTDLSKLDEAVTSYHKALAIKPNFTDALNNLGKSLHDSGNLEDAMANYHKALAINPEYAEAHWNLALVLLLQGDWKKGWEKFEWRFRRKKKFGDRHPWRILPIKKWAGSNLQGKSIVVYAEQGVGDEVTFASCIPDLLEQSPKKVFLECDPRLEPLFARSFPDVHVCGKERNQDLSWIGKHVHLDYSLPIGSLPKFFRNRVEDFPSRNAFLVPEPKLVEKWTQRLSRLGEKLKIGIAWRGGHKASVVRTRSIPLTDWKPLLSTDASFINLQYGDTSNDVAWASEEQNIEIYDWVDNDPLKDLDSHAALISALDLVITIDNSTLHMAGAVGTRTWGLLPFVPDWRWPETFGDSPPWYRSVRLFRQKRFSDWTHAIEEVEQSLKTFLGNARDA